MILPLRLETRFGSCIKVSPLAAICKNILKNWCSQNCRNIHRKTPVLESLFKKFVSLQACNNFNKKRLQHRFFPVNISKFLKIISWETPLVAACVTAQKMKFSIKDFFSKCNQIRSFLRIWSHLLKKS